MTLHIDIPEPDGIARPADWVGRHKRIVAALGSKAEAARKLGVLWETIHYRLRGAIPRSLNDRAKVAEVERELGLIDVAALPTPPPKDTPPDDSAQPCPT